MTAARTIGPLPDIKVAYLCDVTPLDTLPYSGGNTRIYKALRTLFPQVDILSQSWGLAEPVRRLLLHTPYGFQLRARWRLHLLLSPIIRRGIEQALKRGNYDVLFCAYSFHSLYGVRVPKGTVVVYTADATPTTYRGSEVGERFGSYLRLSRRFDPLILKAETATFRSADLLLWPSDWLKSLSDQAYGLSDTTSKVVPWGANVPDPGTRDDAPVLDPAAPVKILFVGRDWYAKGGPLVAEIVADLRASGVDARLTVIGCDPDVPNLPKQALTVFPSLDKSVPAEMAQFQAQFETAHFTVMPSFESYGFAFCEASAYGLPALCRNAGGVPVTDDVNGHALPIDATAKEYADLIRGYLGDPDRYTALRRSTRQRYEEELNWPAWANSVAGLIQDCLISKREKT